TGKIAMSSKSAVGYEGEHNQAAWRAKGTLSAGETRLTTKLNSEEERSKNTLEQRADGSFQKRSGVKVAGKKLGYAMDPKTGEMVAFEDKATLIKADGKRKKLDTTSGLPVGGLEKDAEARIEVTHHSTALGGDVVKNEDGSIKLD